MPGLPASLQRTRTKVRAGIRLRLLALLDVPELRGRIEQLEGELTLLSTAHHHTRADLDRIDADAKTADAALSGSIDELRASAQTVQEAQATQASNADALAQLGRAVGPLARLSEIDITSSWIDLVDQPESMLVSIVMPTHNRSSMLARSIGSVLAQRYARWELLVVDDGSTDDTTAVLDTFDDERIRRFTSDHRGCSGARNVALGHVAGDVIVYLDDDNLMHPAWLKSVVWAFTQHPDVDVLYAARLIDDLGRVQGTFDGGLLPFVQFEVFDREALRHHNLADIGVIAHRCGLADTRFDEQLVMYGDWDLFLRLTADKDPLQLPVIAIGYATDSPNRISDNQDENEIKLVQAKLPPLGHSI